ncbi:RNA-binding S4 domain-containing protein [Picosynechococcus sp. NKBG15041c]|uniref:RNA-binding S4 domain-containing protein n=1 Tax=Picosynechococcus sp. NKBG15041c TaxID=1407650 RepID=UPI000429A77F|nr:RNA-binding S4 domain-containing protein [Picosynechococcus sp. NKBG15041c]
MTQVPSDEPTIQLDQFLKITDLVTTGGQAKLVIQGGFVEVNGETETRRKRKLRHGDVVSFEEATVQVEFDEES